MKCMHIIEAGLLNHEPTQALLHNVNLPLLSTNTPLLVLSNLPDSRNCEASNFEPSDE